MTIFEGLRQDHDLQRDLLEQLVSTSGDTKKRDTLFKKLKHELSIHADGEERFFYVPLIKDELTQEKARHSIAEHHEIDHLIAQLEERQYDDSSWLKIAKKLQVAVEHHLDEEEHEVFQLAGKVLTEIQKRELNKEYIKFITEQRK